MVQRAYFPAAPQPGTGQRTRCDVHRPSKQPPAVHVCIARPRRRLAGTGAHARAEKTATAVGGFRISARTMRQRRRENDDDSRIRR